LDDDPRVLGALLFFLSSVSAALVRAFPLALARALVLRAPISVAFGRTFTTPVFSDVHCFVPTLAAAAAAAGVTVTSFHANMQMHCFNSMRVFLQNYVLARTKVP
jgi:hypothetical protein